MRPRPARRPADKAREGGIPGVFRPKRNDERREATRFRRDGSPAERRVGFITGCLGGMDRRPNAAWVSLFGRDGSPLPELRVGFITGCLGGMDRRPNAAWVSPPAVKSRPTPGMVPRRNSRRRSPHGAAQNKLPSPLPAWCRRTRSARSARSAGQFSRWSPSDRHRSPPGSETPIAFPRMAQHKPKDRHRSPQARSAGQFSRWGPSDRHRPRRGRNSRRHSPHGAARNKLTPPRTRNFRRPSRCP